MGAPLHAPEVWDNVGTTHRVGPVGARAEVLTDARAEPVGARAEVRELERESGV